MKETLQIKNFGPIKDVKLELGKVNIFIGDQGTGKSTVAKLLGAIRTMATGETLLPSAGLMNAQDLGKKEHFKRHLKVFGIKNYLTDSTEIFYSNEYYTFNYHDKESKIELAESTILSLFSLEKNSIISKTNFIPTERTLISLINSSILFKLNEEEFYLPKYISKFGASFDRIKRRVNEWDFQNLLGVKFQSKDEKDWIILNNNRAISFEESASAIQTLIPLLVDFGWKNLMYDSGNEETKNVYSSFRKNIFFLIEEPELNAFPDTQRRVLNYIVENILHSNPAFPAEKKVLLTTHSPYILSSINNLMYAYSVGQHHQKEVSEILSENYWLNPDDVSAYMLVYDALQGGCIARNIMDEETKLIDSIQIDGVSESLNEEFNKLMAVKLGV